MVEKRRKKKVKKIVVDEGILNRINLNAAGIDIASQEHWVAVPSERDEKPVRRFGTTTEELRKIVSWLVDLGITEVAMEATGMYWIPLFEMLEEAGLNPMLVHPSHIKQFSGRKTDAMDCQWIQTLLCYGLLRACFRPDKVICELRTYMRQRGVLVKQAAMNIQHMQKALDQMNVLLHRVVSDITGKTGMLIMNKIIKGVHDPKELAKLRDGRCKKSEKEIAAALDGNYATHHLFCLEQALINHDHFRGQMEKCEQALEEALKKVDLQLSDEEIEAIQEKYGKKKQVRAHDIKFNMDYYLIGMSGVDLTRVESIGTLAASTFLLEVGTDMSKWPTSKHFVSWLAVCPGNHKSGGKQKSGQTRQSANRVANILRISAQSLQWSKGPLGGWFRRMRARLGPAQAITAAAHKLARILYTMLKDRKEYVAEIHKENEEALLEKKKNRAVKQANKLGMMVLDSETASKLTPLLDKLKNGELSSELVQNLGLEGLQQEFVT